MDFKEHNFKKELGIDAQVERTAPQSDSVARANSGLTDIGQYIKDHGPEALRSCEYKGSAAVHIYQSEILGQLFYVSQTSPLMAVPEVTAAEAFRQLQGDMAASYGRTRRSRRSGT